MQNQNQYEYSQRAYGRDRNQTWRAGDYRNPRSTWREDNSNRTRNRSPWDARDDYPQSRFSPNYDRFQGDCDQDLGPSGRDYNDEYSAQGRYSGRPWSSEDYENYNLQQDYSLGSASPDSASSPTRFGRNENRWPQSACGDSGNFGYQPRRPQAFGHDGLRSGRYDTHYDRGHFQSGGQSTGAFGLQQENHRGKGPKGYVRTDEKIREDICECLSDDARIDASDVSVEVRNGVVTLTGSIHDRVQKHRVEDIADSCSGVKDVQNGLRVTFGLSKAGTQSNFQEASAPKQE